MDTIKLLLKNKSELLSFLKSNNLIYSLVDTHKAIEREGLRVNKNTLQVSEEAHPQVFEPKETHKFIKTDYSEAQVEFISPVFNKNNELYNFMNLLYDIFAVEMNEDEILFPYSMPPKLDNIDNIEIAKFDNNEFGTKNKEYREYLTKKYGKEKQLISGIHFNFSLSDEFLNAFYQASKSTLDFSKFKTEIYFKMMRNYNRYKFFITYFQGATPLAYKKGHDIVKGVSLRNSDFGYKNDSNMNIDYSNADTFLKTIEEALNEGKIYDEREIYSTVRLKGKEKVGLRKIIEDGVQYIEVRNIDINPFEKAGISLDEIEFINIFLLYTLLSDECDCETMITEADINMNKVTMSRDLNQIITNCNKETETTLKEYIEKIFVDIKSVFQDLPIDISVVDKFYKNFIKQNYTSDKILHSSDKDFTEYFVELGKQYKEDAVNTQYKYFGEESMELSTQILMREAIKNGIDVEILDRDANFIVLKKGKHIEYIKQCTKTGKDSYVTMLIMENKVVTKKVLEKNNIPTPKGKSFTNIDEAFVYAKSLGENIVIKPNSTNFGIGVYIFEGTATDNDINEALKVGFNEDTTVIVEQFIKGNEYRFLVVGDEVAGILQRVPANVVGDGVKSIQELVEEKNKDPLRGKGYKTPLEKITIDDNVKLFLNMQGKDQNYIPKANEQVFLRQNSNISTGGDSIDHTDDVLQKYKDIAVLASKSVDAKFNGVDMIIEDYSDPNSDFGIIELNFNPAIHIHSFPYKGKRRKIAKKVLETLGFEVK